MEDARLAKKNWNSELIMENRISTEFQTENKCILYCATDSVNLDNILQDAFIL